MKKNRGIIAAIVVMAMTSLSCAQSSNKTTSASPAPELRWKYESGG